MVSGGNAWETDAFTAEGILFASIPVMFAVAAIFWGAVYKYAKVDYKSQLISSRYRGHIGESGQVPLSTLALT